MSNAATTLLALLDHTSADQLETLLEPVHLLIVLEGCGRDRETIQHAIDTGAVPGTLLLALFDEGRTAEELVAMLPDGALERTRARSKARGDADEKPVRRADLDPSLALTDLNRPAVIAWFAALTVPAMLASGALPEWTIATSTAVPGAIVAAGAAGAFIAEPTRLRVAGLVAGLVGAPGAVLLSSHWLALREQPLRIELAMAVALGALPGMVIFLVAYFRHERRR
ncbi:MAG: hypothetical protein RIF41_23040 [Polyangiaceae bacterium]